MPGVFMQPGPDTSTPPLAVLVDMVLASVGGDGTLDGSEMQEIQRLMLGLQAIGEQRVMGQQQVEPDGGTEPAFSGGEGAAPVGDELPEGVQYAGGGY